ncbi:hypothetical protein Vadar_033530 [Vaccinium darrowii]|uniref:Uncharacterized protein n=1 Tax=Vaccinium darrowii TaxID=229202 RepID=A0ACB7ZHA6_9ERIC|nr:hypothetical protein Vadar_033530 [Vaccinium darrowii]
MSGTGTCSNSPHTTTTDLKPNGRQMMSANGTKSDNQKQVRCSFQMPLHYPRFKKTDYETMPEWQLDSLLTEYGLPIIGDLKQKREFAMGAFLWSSSQND